MAGAALPQHDEKSLMGRLVAALHEVKDVLHEALMQDSDALAKTVAQNLTGQVTDMLQLVDKEGVEDVPNTDAGKQLPTPEAPQKAPDKPVEPTKPVEPKPETPKPADKPVEDKPAEQPKPADKPADAPKL